LLCVLSHGEKKKKISEKGRRWERKTKLARSEPKTPLKKREGGGVNFSGEKGGPNLLKRRVRQKKKLGKGRPDCAHRGGDP